MPIEEVGLGYSADALEDSRTTLEKALDQLQKVFNSWPKSTIKRRLKKNAKNVNWPAADCSAHPCK